jgi:Holliday junction resolvase
VRDRNRPVVGDHGPKGSSGKQERDPFTELPKPKQGGARHRRKGDRCEREIVALHLALGVHSERVPYSGAMRYRGHSADVDVYALGREECPLVSECKSRKAGGGFVQLEKWLGEKRFAVSRRNHADPLVLLPWRVWVRLLERVRR